MRLSTLTRAPLLAISAGALLLCAACGDRGTTDSRESSDDKPAPAADLGGPGAATGVADDLAADPVEPLVELEVIQTQSGEERTLVDPSGRPVARIVADESGQVVRELRETEQGRVEIQYWRNSEGTVVRERHLRGGKVIQDSGTR